MKLHDLLSLATRMFRTRPMRTFLTILGVSVGIGTVLFLVSLGYGMQRVILARIANADALLSLDVSPGPSETLTLTAQSVDDIKDLPHVETVARQKGFIAQISLNGITANSDVSAVDRTYFTIQEPNLTKGDIPPETDEHAALISSAGVKLFGTSAEEIIGKKVEVSISIPPDPDAQEAQKRKQTERIEFYTVTGVLDDDSSSSLIVPLTSLRTMLIDRYDQLKVRVDESKNLEEVRSGIIQQGYIVSALSDLIDQANKIFRAVQIVLGLFGLVALIVSSIGMFNTMTIALMERTNEIGIMRSIGVRKIDVCFLFLMESTLMSFLGGVGGVLLGISGGEIANVGINALANQFGGTTLDLFYTPLWFVTVILSFSAIIGFLTGIYPSMRASKLNPLDALRYK